MMGCHFLTDRFSAGHMINKEELMVEATDMLLQVARPGDPHATDRNGEETHQALREKLGQAIGHLFGSDEGVQQAWIEGVHRAHEEGLIAEGEVLLLTAKLGAPWGTIASSVTDVLMAMPWRDQETGGAKLGADRGARGRNQGGESKERGKGEYHLGVGNLAAVQVHDALNKIGFTVRNGKNQVWRLQGDSHLNAKTQEIAHRAVEASQAEVRAGRGDGASVRELMPVEGWINPQDVRDLFLGIN